MEIGSVSLNHRQHGGITGGSMNWAITQKSNNAGRFCGGLIILGLIFGANLIVSRADAATQIATPQVTQVCTPQTTQVGKLQAVEYNGSACSPVYDKDQEATWLVHDGRLFVKLFSDLKNGCAAVVVPVANSTQQNHCVSFEFRKDSKGPFVGVQDPIVRLEYDGSTKTYETVQLKQMKVSDLGQGWKRATYTTGPQKLSRIAVLARGNNVAMLYSARLDLLNVMVDSMPPSVSELKVLETKKFDQLLSP